MLISQVLYETQKQQLKPLVCTYCGLAPPMRQSVLTPINTVITASNVPQWYDSQNVGFTCTHHREAMWPLKSSYFSLNHLRHCPRSEMTPFRWNCQMHKEGFCLYVFFSELVCGWSKYALQLYKKTLFFLFFGWIVSLNGGFRTTCTTLSHKGSRSEL